jgi:putative endopeptidase
MVIGAVVWVGAVLASWPGGDAGVPPGRDFYAFANGGWERETAIPPDRAGFSVATMLAQTTEARLRDLLDHAAAGAGDQPRDEAGKVGAYYAAFLDEGRVEALGGRPLGPALARIRRARDRADLARLMGAAPGSFQGSLFDLTVEPDSRAPDRYVVTLGQAGLGLPDRDAYLSPASAALRGAYRAYVARQLALVRWPAADAAAARVVAFETQVARASWTAAQQRDEARNHRQVSPGALSGMAPGFAWTAYWSGAGLRPRSLVLLQDSAVASLARLYARTPLADLRAWAAFHLADNAAPVLSSPFRSAWFDLHGRRLQGAGEPPPRWRQALRQVSGGGSKALADSRGAMGDAVGRMYVARWLDATTVERLRALTDRLKETLRARIVVAPWMSPAARAEALRKIDAYRIEIGAPDHGDAYDRLLIRRDDLFGDVARATAYDWARRRRRLGQPADRGAWDLTPQTVNAYNYAPFSVVVFTAALLQPPAFDPAEDAALAYGGIGAIIGHELTHAFDDVGRTYDHEGRHRDWWTPADQAAFAAMSDRLVREFDSCEALPGVPVDGRLTLGENIADIGGLQLALEAYHRSLEGRPAPVVEGLTGDQRVFLGFALLRRDKRRPEAIRNDVRTDPHTPDTCRVDEDVRNVDGWYQAFGVGVGDRLYLPPDRRTRIW